MKALMYSILATVVITTGCKNKETEKTADEATETASGKYACPMHPEVTGNKGDKCSKCGMELTEPVAATNSSEATGKIAADTSPTDRQSTTSSFSMQPIIANYLDLKNALVKDDAKGAANSGKALYKAFNDINQNAIDTKNSKEYKEIADDAKEHAEHIGDNAGKIAHQREHFVMLSKDINDLVKIFGTDQKLYQDFCPMADNGKGAIWISESKEIKNPYYGKQMLTCGSVKKEL